MSTEENDNFIGEPSFGGKKDDGKWKNANWRIDDSGDQVYRILPPCHTYARSGRWSAYESIHWGFAGTNGKMRPFRCIQQKDLKTKMVKQECPACQWIEGKRNDYNALVDTLKAENRSKEDIERQTGDMLKWLLRFNLQKGHFVNAMRPDGAIGRLFLKIKCKQNLDILNKKLEAKDKNAISASKGLWLVFTREGRGKETVYPVSVQQEEFTFNGQTYSKDKEAPLTAEVIARMKTEAFDLTSNYTDISYDQVLQLVGAKADPQTVDSVFGLPKVSAMPEEDVEEDVPEFYTPTPTAKPAPEPVVAKAAPVQPSAPVVQEDDSEARLEAQLAALRAKKQAPKVVTQPASSETMELAKAFSLGKI